MGIFWKVMLVKFAQNESALTKKLVGYVILLIICNRYTFEHPSGSQKLCGTEIGLCFFFWLSSYPLSVSWCFLSWSLVRSWWSFWSLLSTLLAFPEGYEPPGLIPMAWNISWAVIGEGPAPSLPSFSCLFAWHDGKILVIMIITEGLWSFKYRSEKKSKLF